jgi:hypothetical protein
MNSWCRERYV